MPSTAAAPATSDEYKAAIGEGYAWLGGFAELRDLTWVDLPTSHWPMWSRGRRSWRRCSETSRGQRLRAERAFATQSAEEPARSARISAYCSADVAEVDVEREPGTGIGVRVPRGERARRPRADTAPPSPPGAP